MHVKMPTFSYRLFNGMLETERLSEQFVQRILRIVEVVLIIQEEQIFVLTPVEPS